MAPHETFPIVPLRDVVVFPHMLMPFIIGRPSSMRALEHALVKDKRIFVAAQHDATVDDPQPADIFTMGCVAKIVQSLKLPDGNIKVLVEGIHRARTLDWKKGNGCSLVDVEIIPAHKETAIEAEGTMSRVVSLFEEYVKRSNNLHYDAMIAAVRVDDTGKLADTIAAHLLVDVNEKQKLLEIVSSLARLHRITELLEAALQDAPLDRRIQRRIEEQAKKLRNEYYVRERQQAIQGEIDALKSKIEASDTAPDLRANAAKDLDRLEVLAKIPDEAIPVPEDLEWPGVLSLRRETHDRPSLGMIHSIVRREIEKHERANVPEADETPASSLTRSAPLWVAVVSGLIGGSVVALVLWLGDWFSR